MRALATHDEKLGNESTLSSNVSYPQHILCALPVPWRCSLYFLSHFYFLLVFQFLFLFPFLRVHFLEATNSDTCLEKRTKTLELHYRRQFDTAIPTNLYCDSQLQPLNSLQHPVEF